MLRRLFWLCLFIVLPVVLVAMLPSPALAAAIDPYLARYLRWSNCPAIKWAGETRPPFHPKTYPVANSCLRAIIVIGATLPDPQVSLTKLKGNSPRDSINNLVTYFRRPWPATVVKKPIGVAKVPELDVTGGSGNLAAFVLTAAQKLLVGNRKKRQWL